ncbi:GumN family protein [Terrihabitans soli]|uniref:GumN family protein n=1 Tax=Terrihabitans soli TaxID=708113 RepID=A0A6S6QYR7_9HYPH|nr:TraB/GumN family protein [Terrihabitans soli]BCJ92422.1 GumN family protein [Terrihabitans soli]
MRAFLAGVLLLLSVEAQAACAGRDLVAELKTSDPAAYASIEEKLKATPNGEGLLWKIEGAKKPSYLFGTIHLSDPRVTTLAPEVKKAFGESSRIAVEIADLTPEQVGATIVQHAMVKGGGTLDNLPDDVEPQVKNALTARGIPGEIAGNFEQWFLVLALAMPPCTYKEMATRKPDEVLDASLIKSAKTARKKVIGLETTEEQIMLFKSLDKDLIRRGLILAPRTEPIAEDVMETMTQAYLTRRVALIEHALPTIAQLTAEETADANYFQRALLDQRNVNMVERSKSELKKGGLFIAVGAGHLAGEKGLVALIRNEGFKVTRLW